MLTTITAQDADREGVDRKRPGPGRSSIGFLVRRPYSAGVIAVVTEADLADLLPLVRGYCDFYGVQPSDQELLAMSRSLIADRDREGLS